MADQIDSRAFDLMDEADDSVSLFNLEKEEEELIVPKQESGKSEVIKAFGSEGYFDFGEMKKGDLGNMYLWIEPSKTDPYGDESYWRYLEKSLEGGRWEASGQSEEYDAYKRKPELIERHWGDSRVGTRIRQAIGEGVEWEDLPDYLKDYNTWRSISPDRDLEEELRD